MRKYIKSLVLILVLQIIGFSAFAAGKIMYVNGKNVPLKNSTSLFAKQITTLSYGTEVEVLETKGNFTKIKVVKSGKNGWIKSSFLTSKKISSTGKISTDADEITLAGKGNQVETTIREYVPDDITDAK